MSDINARQLIKTVEDALAIVARRSDKLGITLTKAELELSVIATEEGGGTLKFDWIVTVEAGVKLESSSKHVLSLTLVPKSGIAQLSEGVAADELADAIVQLAATIKDAGQSKFVVTDGRVEVKFVATREGKLKLVVGGGVKAEDAHTIKLTFQLS